MDLGGLRATVGGHFNEEESDKRFTPGEWMAVVGKHLNDPSAEVRIGGSPVALESMVDEGLLVRLPRGLSPFETATITVRTSAGQDSFDIKPQSYLIVSDTGGGAVRFFRTAVTPSEDSLFEPECDHVALERARFHAVSRTGALLYAVAGAKEMFHRFLPKLMAHLKSDELNRRSRLLTFRLEENALRQTNEVGMPERTIPLHLAALSGGGVLVNAADFSVTELSDASGIVDNLRAVLGVLLSAVQIGSVLSVDPKGNITTVAEGISLFLTTAQIPGRNDFVSLVMRIAVKKFPPSVGVKLSIDTLNPDGRREGELLLRNLERSFILPPYDTPDLSFQ